MTKQGQRISASVSILIFFSFSSFEKKPLTLFRFFFWRLQIYNQLTYAACDFIASSQYVFCVSLFFKFMPTYLLNTLIIVKTFLHNFVETFSSPLTI